MKLIFFGTPDFAVPSLMELSAHHEVIAVVTREDKPSGRGLKLKESAVKVKAKELGIPVYQPERLDEFKPEFNRLNADLSIVVAYGKIIPEWILNHNLGTYNVHGSLLPKYRGAAPIQRAILNDDVETGITLQKVVPELDAGDIISVRKVVINKKDTAGTLHDKLAVEAADLLIKTLPEISKIKPVKQNESDVTWAPKITKEDTLIDWDQNHIVVYNKIRGLNPVPGAVTSFKGVKVKIWDAELDLRQDVPGKIIEITKNDFVVSCGEGSLKIGILQPANKNKIKAVEFAGNVNLKKGEIVIDNF